jgi:flagellar hook-length control protein FliK
LISNLFEDMDVTGTSELKNLLMENDLVVTYEGLEKAPVYLGPNGEVIGVKLSPDEMISSQVLNTDPLIQDESNQTPLTPTENETPVEVKAPLVSEETKVKAELENFDFEEVQEMEVEKKVVDAPSTQQNSEGFNQNQNGKKNDFAFETNVVNNTSVQYSTNVTQDSTISFANVVEESTTSYTNIDVEDIMNQIVTQTRTQVSDTLTSMELELHPASLGKMYLQVTENNGSITAKLYTENQDVKVAMETQMAILKETWNQQGMKVNAIEISVGTREFEEQLDAQANATFENGSSSFNGSGEGEPAKRNRNLSLTGLEELPEDMTEEERLTVNMMKDLGNSINFTA